MISRRRMCAVGEEGVSRGGVVGGCARVQWLLAQRTTSGWRRRCDCHWDLAVLCRPCSEALAPRAMAKRSIMKREMCGRVCITTAEPPKLSLPASLREPRSRQQLIAGPGSSALMRVRSAKTVAYKVQSRTICHYITSLSISVKSFPTIKWL